MNLALYIVIVSGLIASCANKDKVETDISKPNTVLKIPPRLKNPRNSEGDFITLKNGRILFIYTHFTGDSYQDHASAFLAGRYSDDKGKTWSTEDRLIIKQEGIQNVMSVSLLRLQNDEIALFYLMKNSDTDCIPMVRLSEDEGKTWSTPLNIAISKDEGKTWENKKTIEENPKGSFCYTAIHFINKDVVLLGYFDWATRGITIKRLNTRWIYD